jgi:hypothetical protein
MDMFIGTSSFVRDRGNFPELPVVNMFAEQSPTDNKLVLISRAGLGANAVSMGTGPVAALFQGDGVLSGGLFGVSGGRFYDASSDEGAIAGPGPASMAGYDNQIFIANGSTLYKYNGTTLSTVTFPDSANVLKVVSGSSRIVAVRKDSQRIYWTDPLGATFAALDFASAEYIPDNIKDILFIGDALVIFGSETTEFWPVSGDVDIPFAPMSGRVFNVGVKATGAATKFGSSFAWVTNQNTICINTPENIVSYPGLEAKIEDSTDVRLWTFIFEGTEFLALTLDTETWVLHPRSNGSWTLMESFGETNWKAGCFAGGVFGSSVDGACYNWVDEDADFGGTLERRFRAWLPIEAGLVQVFNVLARVNAGRTTYLSTEFANPTIEMRFSYDGGQNWSEWRERSLGPQGKYRAHPKWNSLGSFAYPGILLEFRVTDEVPFRVSGVSVNEQVGGK